MRAIFSCFVFLLFPVLGQAQINESDTLRIKADLSLSGFGQAGNVETLIFRANSNISIKTDNNWVFKTQNSYVYQEFGLQKADEDILSLNFLSFNPKKQIYPLALGFISTNYRREINLRYLVGAGATLQVFHHQKNWLQFSVSSEFEKTEFKKATFNRVEYNGTSTITTMRGTIWVHGRYHLFDDSFIFNHESYYQPSLDDRSNFRWQANIGFEFPIWEYLNITLTYRQTFESVVIENQKQEDRFLTLGFKLKSY